MLRISYISLRLFLENSSILNKMPIIGQASSVNIYLQSFIVKNVLGYNV